MVAWRRWAFGVLAAVLSLTQVGLGQDPRPTGVAATAADPALMAWWKMDETSGTTAADASGLGNTGRLIGGPTWIRGLSGNALKLDGINDYVAIENLMYERGRLSAVTVAAWVRTTRGNDQIIASFDRNQYWQMEINGAVAQDGQIGWGVMTDVGQAEIRSTLRVDDGNWHHVACTYNEGQLAVYVDGSVSGTSVVGRSFGTGTIRYGFLGVGSRADRYDGGKSPTTYYNGELDDVRIYSRALGQTEIAQLALRGPANDACENAEPIKEVTNQPFDTTDATSDGPGMCVRSPNLWYLYTPSVTGVCTVSLCGSQFDTVLAVYRGAACNPGWDRLIGCNDDSCGMQSQLTFDVTAGQSYLIEVGGFGRSTGQGVLTVTCEAVAPAEFDLGDAPDSSNSHGSPMTAYTSGLAGPVLARFPTVFEAQAGQPRGPLHRRPGAVAFLGQAVSLEAEADTGSDDDLVNNLQPASDKADQDGKDDGVVLPIEMPQCGWAALDYTITVVEPGTDLWVNVWCDWNRDGDWDDDSTTDTTMTCEDKNVTEWAVQNQFLYGLAAGTHAISSPAFIAWHPTKGPEKVWMRITLSEQPWKGGSNVAAPGNAGSGPAEGYDIGETEDYLVTPVATCPLCEDRNKDGTVDFEDLIELMHEWLENCVQ